jgi:endonuclease/exonuclease/phosphatase family metal-dependent hydrolase
MAADINGDGNSRPNQLLDRIELRTEYPPRARRSKPGGLVTTQAARRSRRIGTALLLAFTLGSSASGAPPAPLAPPIRPASPGSAPFPTPARRHLRVLTINAWSGLDYRGTLRFGALETAAHREARYGSLLVQLRALAPDIVFLQEANPAAGFSNRLARDLGYTSTHQVCIGGIRIGPLGIPTNCKEGNAILARRELRLQKKADWKLSGSFGLFGDPVTVHFDEAVFAQLAQIYIDDQPVSLVNVHLVAAPSQGPALAGAWADRRARGEVSESSYGEALDAWRRGLSRQDREMVRLAREISKLPRSVPMIVGGDFNASPDAGGIREFARATGLHDTFGGDRPDAPGAPGAPSSSGARFSWDPARNPNARVSAELFDPPDDPQPGREGRPVHEPRPVPEPRPAYERLCALADSFPRRIDYVFLGSQFDSVDARDGRIVLDDAPGGVFASDHFGVLADVDLDHALQGGPHEPAGVSRPEKKIIDPFPLANYDSDTGVGYGAKLFLLNTLGSAESFDLTFFHSTKGERWYRLAFSWPDPELRQGKEYPVALDLVADYDKYINASFFGTGSGATYADRENYTREPLDVSLTLGRGFSPRVVGQVGVRSRTVRNSRFSEGSRLRDLPPALNAGRANYVSVLGNVRWDSRDSYINPSRGLVLQGEVEGTPGAALGNVSFTRAAVWAQHYSVLWYPPTVLALRVGAQRLFGDHLPVQVLLPLGGNGSLRGSPQDRFLGRATALANAELRFSVVGRLGGVLGWDAGKAWEDPSSVDLRGWTSNPTVGLRLVLRTFVVRCDVGIGKETTGLYLNFGQLF